MGDTSHRPGDGDPPDTADERTLTRRDAVSALAAAGVTAVAGCSGVVGGGDSTETPAEKPGDASTPGGTDEPRPTATDGDAGTGTSVEAHEVRTLHSLAGVLYPSEVEATVAFLETYLYGRVHDEAAYDEAVADGVETLDALAREQYDQQFDALDHDQQESVLLDSAVRSGASVADGTDVERLNYHLVDELLFALYASSMGGELVGNENPRGWAGGYGDSPAVSK